MFGRSARPSLLAWVHPAPVLGPALVVLATSCIEATPYPDRSPPPAPARQATAPSHGFNDAIAWRSLEDGLAESRREGRPMMLLVHASWCGRCKELKPSFQESRMTELAARFVMVNADQDQTPDVLRYAPDGSYIPRVLFFDPKTGELDPSLQNPNRDRHHYYYSPRDDLAGMMEKALARHGKS